MRGIMLYMGWSQISTLDTATSAADEGLFSGPKQQSVDKISLNILTDEMLCKKLDKLNVTLVKGYPSRSSEAQGLLKDQKDPRTRMVGFAHRQREELQCCVHLVRVVSVEQ